MRLKFWSPRRRESVKPIEILLILFCFGLCAWGIYGNLQKIARINRGEDKERSVVSDFDQYDSIIRRKETQPAAVHSEK